MVETYKFSRQKSMMKSLRREEFHSNILRGGVVGNHSPAALRHYISIPSFCLVRCFCFV